MQAPIPDAVPEIHSFPFVVRVRIPNVRNRHIWHVGGRSDQVVKNLESSIGNAPNKVVPTCRTF